MATINLTAGVNDVVQGNPAEADIVIVPAGSLITENDFVFNFQTPDRLDLTAFPVLNSIGDVSIQPLQGGAVRVSSPLFGQITLIGIDITQISNNNFIFAGTQNLADLTIQKSASATSVLPGGNLTYTLIVSNVGQAAASGIVVRDTLPPGFTITSTAGAGGFTTTPSAAGTVEFTGGTLAPGASATLTITGTAPATAGTAINTAVVDPGGLIPEVTEANNTATFAVTVGAAPIPTAVYVDDNLAGTATGATVAVDPDGTGPQQPVTGLVFGQTAFASIQNALDFLLGVGAPANATVFVAPGTYNEFVNFVRPFILLGPNADIDPVTQGGTRVDEAIIGSGVNGGGIGFERTVPSNNGPVTIAGFSFASKIQPAPGTLGGYGIDLTDSNGNVTIRNNIFENDVVGIGNRISSQGVSITSNIIIEQNLFNMSGGTPTLQTPFVAMALQQVNGAAIRNNRINAATGLAIDPRLTPSQAQRFGQPVGSPVPGAPSSGFNVTGNLFTGFFPYPTPASPLAPPLSPSGQQAIVNFGSGTFSIDDASNSLVQPNVTGLTLV
ncbi:DUF11 domain-containing protein [Geitlerinema splendidum]|nr:DUF11 domain-containing protein [Geitlerinema splendidum]